MRRIRSDEAVGVVLEDAVEAVLVLAHRDRQGREGRAPLGRRARELDLLEVEAAQVRRRERRLQDEGGVEQAAGRADRRGLAVLEQRLVREVRPGVGVEGDLARARGHLGEARIPGEIEPQGDRVGHVADERLQLAAAAVADRRADHEVVLAAVSSQGRGVRRQHRHERGDAARLAERVHRAGRRTVDPEQVAAAAEAGRSAARAGVGLGGGVG
jgi:hypothetical protein